MSIKKKLVTAVTTAGLLAGLFGSAFVPSVRAAAAGAVAFTAGSSAEDYNDTTGLIAYYSASVYPQALFTYTPTATDDALANGAYELVVSGATIRSCTATAAAGGAVTAALINSAQTSCFTTYTWTADGAFTFNITLSKLAAGASATVTVVDPDGDSATPTLAKTLTGIAATATATALSTTKTAAAIKVGWDGDATYGETTDDVADTTIGGVDFIATAQNLGSEFQFGGGLQNGYGTALTTDTTLVIEVTAGNFVNCETGAAQDGTIATGTASIMVLSVTDNSGLFECRVISEDGAEGAGGNVAVDVKTLAEP